MIKIICALALLSLIVYTQSRKIVARRRGKAIKCESCGRTIVERPVKIKVDDKELVFCCEHCAQAYLKGHGH